jgi:hypothetical protein
MYLSENGGSVFLLRSLFLSFFAQLLMPNTCFLLQDFFL